MPRRHKAEDEKLKPRSVPLSDKTWGLLEEEAGSESVGSVARAAIENYLRARRKKKVKEQQAAVTP